MDGAVIFQRLKADILSNPFPVFERLQREAPIFWDDALFAWVVSKYIDCRHVLQRPDKFTRDRRKNGRQVADSEMTIQTVDPPDQIALRQAFLESFRRVGVKAACSEAMDLFERRLDRQSRTRPFDFMSCVAAPTAIRFACNLVGVPEIAPKSYRSTFLRLTRAMDREVYALHRGKGTEATRELNGVIDAAIATAPPGSMIHELYAVSGVGEMPHAYVRNTLSAAFNAAFSTAYSSMGSFFLLCLERRDLAARIVTTGKIFLSVNELLRFTSPAQSTARYANCETEIAGVRICRNDPIVTLIAAANRDPEIFELPNEIVLDRSPNPHLSFGYGPHHCIGAKPAEEFLSHFVARLVEWTPRFTLAADPTWLDTATLRCLDVLPLSRDNNAVPCVFY
ncbi:cytochrome P450 [Rhizobium ruizarguesonis]